MVYIVIDDLNIPDDTLQQLTDDALTGIIDPTKVDKAIADAEALVDGYCGKRYKVPFDLAPAIVKQCAVALAKYNLHVRRGTVPEELKDERKYAMAVLSDISTGKCSIGIEPIPTQAASVGGVIQGPDRVFGRDKMRGF